MAIKQLPAPRPQTNGALALSTTTSTPFSHRSMVPSPSEPGGSIPMWGYVKHKQNAWADQGADQYALDYLLREYVLSIKKRVREGTVVKYQNSHKSIIRSIEAAGEPAILDSLTPAAGDRWIDEQRERGLAPEGIASRQAAVKVFARKYLWQQLELTNWDILGKWARVKVEVGVKERLTDAELEQILASCDDSPNGLRDRAFVMVFLSTGLRFAEVLGMTVADVDMVSGEFAVVAKGGKERPVRMSPGALKAVKRYLRWRRTEDADEPALWTGQDGRPLAYFGGVRVFQRIRKRAGVPRLTPHLCRHTYGQGAIQKGADRALVQDLLGHETDAMTRRYTRSARAADAAHKMPQFSLV
jgi:site-specific recombinase XerD